MKCLRSITMDIDIIIFIVVIGITIALVAWDMNKDKE
jgi:hypothetical protein